MQAERGFHIGILDHVEQISRSLWQRTALLSSGQGGVATAMILVPGCMGRRNQEEEEMKTETRAEGSEKR